MTDIFVGEKGKRLLVETGFDLSSATGVEIHFSAPPGGGTSFVNSASVSVLAANITTSACGIFSALKTVEYIVNSADFSMSAGAGTKTWKGWIEADFDAATHLISSSFRFVVSNPG